MWLTKPIVAVSMVILLGGCNGHFPLALERLLPQRSPKTHSPEHTPQTLQRQLATLLAGGKHLAALSLIGIEIAHGQAENHFLGQYSAALNGVLNKALHLQHADQSRQAGALYRAAWVNYPRSLVLRDQTLMTLTEIDASIELCANALLEEGLQAYRRGALEEAIDSWEAISVFHPEHVASQRSIATTRTQLANLKRLNQPK